MRCDCKHCWMNSITQIIHKASTLSAFKTSCCQNTLTWKCRIFMATVHVMFHYERALPRTNTFVNSQTTFSLQAQTNEVWELMHHNGIPVALQQEHHQSANRRPSWFIGLHYFQWRGNFYLDGHVNKQNELLSLGPASWVSECQLSVKKVTGLQKNLGRNCIIGPYWFEDALWTSGNCEHRTNEKKTHPGTKAEARSWHRYCDSSTGSGGSRRTF